MGCLRWGSLLFAKKERLSIPSGQPQILTHLKNSPPLHFTLESIIIYKRMPDKKFVMITFFEQNFELSLFPGQSVKSLTMPGKLIIKYISVLISIIRSFLASTSYSSCYVSSLKTIVIC